MTTKKQEQEQKRQQAIKFIRELLLKNTKKGEKPVLYTVLKHVSSSGMMRHIDVIAIDDGQPININWHVEQLGTYKRAKSYDAKNADSLRVGGCGMDMGFAVVYNISCVVFRDYDIANLKVQGRNGQQYETTDGGYIINHKWL
jgi:hypothetical protein